MDNLQLEQHGSVAWVWLNRPERLNALNQQTIDELYTVFETLRADTAVHTVVIAGRGRAFCAGFDIRWMAERTPEMIRADRADLRSLYDLIEHHPCPVIAAVHGSVMGGGLILALVSDFVLAAEPTSFGAPEIRIGVFPSLRLIPRLERAIGYRAAKQMVLSGDSIDAPTAQQLGLVTRITYADNLYSEAQALAEKLASPHTQVVQAIKAAFLKHGSPDFDDWETDMSALCWAQPERAEAMREFLNRKRPG
jgi:enoyl-CoA hydratase/carnithine racemase